MIGTLLGALVFGACGFVITGRVQAFHDDVDFVASLGSRLYPNDVIIVKGSFWTGKVWSVHVQSEGLSTDF